MTDLVGLDIEQRGDVVIARVRGELDVAVAPATGERIAAAVPSSAAGLVVDLSELSFMDSSGVAMLFRLTHKLGGRRQELHVAAPPGAAVTRVLEIVELGRAARVHPDLEEAVAALARR